jgi:hypothetical protein
MLDAVRVSPTSWDDADVQRLAGAQQAELRARYDGGHTTAVRSRGRLRRLPTYRPIAAFGACAGDADGSLFYERVLPPA